MCNVWVCLCALYSWVYPLEKRAGNLLPYCAPDLQRWTKKQKPLEAIADNVSKEPSMCHMVCNCSFENSPRSPPIQHEKPNDRLYPRRANSFKDGRNLIDASHPINAGKARSNKTLPTRTPVRMVPNGNGKVGGLVLFLFLHPPRVRRWGTPLKCIHCHFRAASINQFRSLQFQLLGKDGATREWDGWCHSFIADRLMRFFSCSPGGLETGFGSDLARYSAR